MQGSSIDHKRRGLNIAQKSVIGRKYCALPLPASTAIVEARDRAPRYRNGS
jgi:hypothetical protein